MTKRGINTHGRIVEKSLYLFALKGYFNTAIADILEETDLTKGGLYGHFRSKKDIWYAAYEEAVTIWKKKVLNGLREYSDPIERIKKVIEQDLMDYLGSKHCENGCFFNNMLVELSNQEPQMSKQILQGFLKFSKLIASWLEEANRKGQLRENLNFKEISEFIIIALNGTAGYYSAQKDPKILKRSTFQLCSYLDKLKK